MGVHKVAIVLGPCFGSRLHTLTRRMHVWAVGSEENVAAAAQIRADDRQHPAGYTVTTMGRVGHETPEVLFCDMLDEVDEHHGVYAADPPWRVLHVCGIALTPAVQRELERRGATMITTESDGHFVAVRGTRGL